MKQIRVVVAVLLLLTQTLPVAGAGWCLLRLGHHNGCPASPPSTTAVTAPGGMSQSAGCMKTPVCTPRVAARPEYATTLEFLPTPEHRILFASCDLLMGDSRSPPVRPPDSAAA